MNIRESLLRGIVDCLPAGALDQKLAQGRPLRIKLGADPTAPDLHLGHAVVLCKLRDFQDAGHIVQFIIGDFTALIGDPTGKSKTRPPLTPEEIARNAATYLEQVTKVLRSDRLEIVTNSTWLSPLTLTDFVKIAGKVTLARLIERDDFAKRLSEGVPVSFHELFYPLMQGYDSVMLRSDVELGGTDQTFNLLMGRFLQEQFGQEPQVIMTVPLLEGLDGVQKMSKSLGNYVGLFEAADQAYGKLMSISDELMWRYWLLLTSVGQAAIAKMQHEVKTGALHPLVCKKQLAHAIVSRFWSPAAADEGQRIFEALFQQKDYSQAAEVTLPDLMGKSVWVVELLRQLGAAASSSEARRLVSAGAVSLNDQKITDPTCEITCQRGDVVRVGKHRIYRLA